MILTGGIAMRERLSSRDVGCTCFRDSLDVEVDTVRIGSAAMGERRFSDSLRGVASGLSGVINGGRSFGTVGSGLLFVLFRKWRGASRELDELRDEDRLAIWKHPKSVQSYYGVQMGRAMEFLTILRRLAAPQRFSISLQ